MILLQSNRQNLEADTLRIFVSSLSKDKEMDGPEHHQKPIEPKPRGSCHQRSARMVEEFLNIQILQGPLSPLKSHLK